MEILRGLLREAVKGAAKMKASVKTVSDMPIHELKSVPYVSLSGEFLAEQQRPCAAVCHLMLRLGR